MFAIDIISNVFASIFGWFESIISASGLLPLYLGAVGIVLSCRFLLMPLLGGSGSSDRARKKDHTESY